MRSRSGRSASYYAAERLKAHSKGREAAEKRYPMGNNPYPAATSQRYAQRYNHMDAMHRAWRDGWMSYQWEKDDEIKVDG